MSRCLAQLPYPKTTKPTRKSRPCFISSAVLAQMLKLLPRHEFEALAQKHHKGRKLRKIIWWPQFVTMVSAQLTGRSSLRYPDRKSTRLNSSHVAISYAVFCLKKKNKTEAH